MKIFHLSDLHIGKRVNEFSMLADQQHILSSIVDSVQKVRPEVVVIAGDIYDKAVPSAEAVSVFDEFLTALSKTNTTVLAISGNHDSPERIAFGGDIMKKSGIYLSKVYSRNIQPIILGTEKNEVRFYLLPFIKPQVIRSEFDLDETPSYTECVKMAIDEFKVDKSKKNVLVCHQFVTGGSTCESEDISIGGQDNVDASVFDGFDYVALGHLHGGQNIKSQSDKTTIRYSGSPLKYSFSEVSHKKSITVVDITQNGVTVDTLPLKPLHDMVVIKGDYNTLMSKSFCQSLDSEDYYKIILTDEKDILEATARLRTVYKNLMRLEYDNKRTQQKNELTSLEYLDKKSPLEHFCDFYKYYNNQDMDESQQAIMTQLVDKIWGGDK